MTDIYGTTEPKLISLVTRAARGLKRDIAYLTYNERNGEMENIERMLKWFEYKHLPPELQDVSKQFHVLAMTVCNQIEQGPERTVSLRMLLQSKDAAVRAKLHPGG